MDEGGFFCIVNQENDSIWMVKMSTTEKGEEKLCMCNAKFIYTVFFTHNEADFKIN